MAIIQASAKHNRTALLAALVYCALSGVWIFVTDKLLGLLKLNPQTMMRLSLGKGLLYVGVSGALIYLALKRRQDVNEKLESMVASRTSDLQEKQAIAERQTETLKNLIECTPAGLAIFDREMRYLEVSSRWCKDYGLDRNVILGKSHYDVFPNIPERWKEVHRHALAGEVLRSDLDNFTDANGKEHWLRWEVRPWGNGLPKSGGIIIFTEDISERRHLERQLLQAQKMETVGRLAGGVAHDFNNLLMIIRMSTELLMLDADDPDEVLRHGAEILQASDKAASVTKQLLAFSRKQTQELKVVDIDSLLTAFCRMIPTLIGEDIEFEVIAATKHAAVRVDPTQFEQVIMNLVVNARDAMPAGGKLTIDTSVAEIDEESSRHHDAQIPSGYYVVLSVTDTGCGMDAKTKERLFEPFFTTKPVGQGTGLGLSTVYGIVKQSNGYVWVYSEVGQGTTFRIYLPLVDSAQRHESVCPTPSLRESFHRANGKATILLVEDQPKLREVMREYLQTRGFTVLCAENGHDALQAALKGEDPIHLLLTDIVMPGMQGTEVAQKILQIHPRIKVLFMSGYPGHSLETNGLTDATFLQKPIDLKMLAAKIEDVLGAAQ